MGDVRIAIYIRLSMADEETGKSRDESNSIVNQRSLIHRFLDNNEELCHFPRTEFVDDGFTGTNTNRPAFMRMIGRIRDGQYNLCITKDFSRFSRDYIEMGDYLECLFPFLSVRYISINDGYDSRDYKGTTGGLDIVMRTIVYDAYSKDLSLKEKTAKLQICKKGRRASGNPGYGYMKDPDNKGMDIVDPEAAAVVRRIFDEALAGSNVGLIAKGLNEDGIKTPAEYFMEKHPESGNFRNISDKQAWTYKSVYAILRRYTYTGAAVGGLTKQLMPCKRVKTKAKREEWIVVHGMHEAIVTPEEYEKAQEIIAKGRILQKPAELYPLRSLVVCGYCGRHMTRRSEMNKFCCTFGRNGVEIECKGLYSQNESEMEKIVFNAIKDFIAMRETDREADNRIFLKKKLEANKICVNINELEGKIALLKRKKLDLYEKYCTGQMNKSTYLAEKSSLDEAIEELAEAIEACKSRIDDCADEESHIFSETDAVCEAFKDEAKLTYDMAHAFIEKINVYWDDRMEIIWRFKK